MVTTTDDVWVRIRVERLVREGGAWPQRTIERDAARLVASLPDAVERLPASRQRLGRSAA